jgi:secondary thiamine-phosphate synthase enzyme
VQSVVDQSGVDSGLASVFVPGSTAAVTTMEHEPGGVHDLREALDRLVPRDGHYELGGDPPTSGLRPDYPPGTRRTNAHAHIRAAIVGPSETLPVRGGRLEIGTWQQIVLVDFDDRPRQRTVVVRVLD